MKTNLFFTGIFLFFSITLVAQVPSSGLAASWLFNGNANDESTNSNHGTVNGATLTTDRFGNANSAYNFDGATGYISVPDNSLMYSDEMTISWWYRVMEYTAGNHVAIAWLEPGYKYQQFFSGTSFAYFNGYNSGSGGYFNPTYDLTTVNEWQNITVTYTKLSETTSTTTLYVNGLQKQSDNHTMAMAYSPGYNFYIGKNHNGNFFIGALDDIRIYTRVLTETEIKSLYDYIPTGISDNTFNSNILVSPNPTDGNVSINLGSVYQKVKIKLTDVAGRLILTQEYPIAQKFALNFKGKPGIYFLTILSEPDKAVIKLIKK
jgi:hypothetical protein